MPHLDARHGLGGVIVSRLLRAVLGPVARDVELEDGRVVDEAVDGRRCGHRVFEDAVPLAEDEVRRDEHAAPLVALGHEGEEDLDLLGGLLDVSDVVDLCGAPHKWTHVERLVMWSWLGNRRRGLISMMTDST